MKTKMDSSFKIEWWPVSRLIPYGKNPRKISDAAVTKVAESIKEFGWRQPIVVDLKGVIIIGHARRLAAIKLAEELVPVHVANLVPEKARLLRLADNRTGEEAIWDLGLLAGEFSDLSAGGFDLAASGFDGIEIDKLLKPGSGELGKLDDAAKPPVNPVSRLGDLWLLGKHRVICGDSSSSKTVSILLGERKPGLMVTDPPYGVDYDPEWRLRKGLNKAHQNRAEGTVTNDDQADWSAAWGLFPGDVAYVWHAALHSWTVASSLLEHGFEIRSQIIWAKPSLVIGRGHYHWQHEPAWYAVRKGKTALWAGDRKQSTVWAVQNMHPTQGSVDDGHTIHSTQKPLELMRRPILNHTKRGAAIYDPFLGSGSTLIACEESGRVCYGVDIDPKYIDVAVERWQKMTGKTAIIQGGETMVQLAKLRKVKYAR